MGLLARVKNWIKLEKFTSDDLNAEVNNILNNLKPTKIMPYDDTVSQMQESQSPGSLGAEVLPTTLAEEIKELRYMLAAITGKSYWYQSPASTIAELSSLIANPVPNNRIVTGLLDANNQGVFLQPLGASAAVKLVNTAPGFSAYFVGTQHTFVATITLSGLSLAPASNNTCTVSLDAGISNLNPSKLLGEQGTYIPIGSVGSEITALTGKLAGFKHTTGGQTEYFIAEVDSTNAILKNAFRGYFFDSTNTYHGRNKLTNADTITLMKLSWVFATYNSSVEALDVTYNQPTVAATQPASASIADWWYDIVNTTWKRYSGSAWVNQAAVFAGYCMQDTSNCVAARSQDFYESYDVQNNFRLTRTSDSVVRTLTQGMRASVYGTKIFEEKDNITWTMSSSLDTGAEAASTTYYLYLTTTGVPYISATAPHDRRFDLLGWYHPSKPWRCVGEIYNDAAQNFDGGTLYADKYRFEDLNDTAQTRQNHFVNGWFDIWQEIEAVATTFTNGNYHYGPDQWYGKNSLGTNGVLTISQQAGVNDGSKYGCKLHISTAPTAAFVNGCELYQTLEARDSILFFDQKASFSVLVKAAGLVTQIGVQFFYKTTEAKIDTAIGTEQLFTVSTSGWCTAFIAGQYMGTSMTTSGSVGVRIRITAVSSGNTYDLNNGFVVEQAMMNLGSLPATSRRKNPGISAELINCQRYYWKTFAQGTAPAQGSGGNGIIYRTNGSWNHSINVCFPVPMLISPTMTTYNPSSANTKWRNLTAGADSGTPSFNTTTVCFEVIDGTGSATQGQGVGVNVTADARL